MKKYLLALILFFPLYIFSQNYQQPQISFTIKVTDGRTDTRNLRIGVDPLATDGIDDVFGEGNLPPYPPQTIFEARFNLPLNNFNGTQSSYWDFRNGSVPFTGTIEHRLAFQKGEGDSVVIFWNFPNTVSATLQDVINGSFINISMSGEGSYVVQNPGVFNQLKLLVNYNNTATDISENWKSPDEFYLYQNYPNPFNPSTIIKFSVNKTQLVKLKVYDILGNEIETLLNEIKSPGTYEVIFTPDPGMSAGIYYYEIFQSNLKSLSTSARAVKKMIYLK
mgnify:CR=1 FL=1|jgi:hypothetical protein